MNRTSIPGFYFDEERKKFFRIQPNHKAPADAKYSQTNVKRENRRIKRQKIEDKREAKRQSQTVSRARILNDPFVGRIGLQREVSGVRASTTLVDGDAALVSQLQGTRLYPHDNVQDYFGPTPHLLDVGYDTASNELKCFASWGVDCYALTSHGLVRSGSGRLGLVNPRARMCKPACSLMRSLLDVSTGSPDVIVSKGSSRSSWQSNIAASSPWRNPGQLPHQSPYYTDTDPLALAIDQNSLELAVRESLSVTVLDLETRSKVIAVDTGVSSSDEDDGRHYCPAIDWLDTYTVIFGSNYIPNQRHVVLWDTRANDRANRFETSRRITGIRTADDSGGRILVTTNYGINLFDTRMGFKPYVAFPHIHEGSELQFATNKRGLLAAVDKDNVVQVYSTSTASLVGHLSQPEFQSKSDEKACGGQRVQSLKWFDGGREGSIVMACQGSTVLRWDWQGSS